MRRFVLSFAVLAAAAAPAFGEKPPEAKQFLDKSVVSFPRATGYYALAETHYDPAQWVGGVTSKWVANAAPGGVLLSVFAYPIGRTGEEQAVAMQIAEVENSMHDAVKHGLYSDLVIGERTPFTVVAPKPSIAEDDEDDAADDADGTERADMMPKPELELEAGKDADPILSALAASQASPNNHGQRQSFRFTHKGVPVRSLAYVFYRNLFGFKVRVTAPVDSMDETMFTALSDTAARTLVPLVDVKNYGLCGNITLPKPDDKADEKETTNAMTQELILAVARVKAENCAVAPAEASEEDSRGRVQVEIVYPPGVWKSSD